MYICTYVCAYLCISMSVCVPRSCRFTPTQAPCSRARVTTGGGPRRGGCGTPRDASGEGSCGAAQTQTYRPLQ